MGCGKKTEQILAGMRLLRMCHASLDKIEN